MLSRWPGTTARSRVCHLARRRAQPSFVVLDRGLGVLSHGRSAVPYRGRGADICFVPLSPPGPAGITGTLLNARRQLAGRLSRLVGDGGWCSPSQESSAAVGQGPAQSRLGREPP